MNAPEDGVSYCRRIAIGGGAAMFVGIAMGRFSYTTMLPPLIESGQLSELEAGYVGGFNLAAFFLGAYFSERLRNALSIRLLLSGAVWLGVLALVASAVPAGFYWLAFWRAVLGAVESTMAGGPLPSSTVGLDTDAEPG